MHNVYYIKAPEPLSEVRTTYPKVYHSDLITNGVGNLERDGGVSLTSYMVHVNSHPYFEALLCLNV
jgi:hypothetical protein